MEWHLRVGRVCDCFLRALWYRHTSDDRPNCVCCGGRCFAALLVLHRRIDQFLCVPTERAAARNRANHSTHRQEGDDLHNRHGAVSCELAHPGGNWYGPHLACRCVGRWSFKLHRTASSLARKRCLPLRQSRMRELGCPRRVRFTPRSRPCSGHPGSAVSCQYRLLRQSRRSYCLCLQPR
jgi:hypothetical protein